MKFLIFVLVALAAVVALTLIALEDPGYVLISRAPYEIEVSLALLAVIAVVGFALLYFSFRFLSRVTSAPRDIRQWGDRHKMRRAQDATMQGYARLITGEWERAEKKLAGSLEHHPTPLLSYLGAAYAAQQQGDTGRRDQYLRDASQREPAQRFAVGLTKARLEAQSGQLEQARETLEKLRSYAPTNKAVLRLLSDVYRDARDWQQVTGLMPALAKVQAFPEQELRERELEAYAEMFANPVIPENDGSRLLGTWETLPRAKKRDPEIVAMYARRLIDTGRFNECEGVLRNAIRRGWSSELVYLYGLADSDQSERQYKLARSWLSSHESEPDLHLTLGRLAIRRQRWHEAREHLERAVALGGRAEAFTELGQLYERDGRSDRALECFRQGMLRAAPSHLPELSNPASAGAALADKRLPDAQDGELIESGENSKESK